MVLFHRVRLFFGDESGQVTTDFMLISMAVALAAVISMQGLATHVSHAFLASSRVFNAAIGACLHHHHA